MLPSFDSFLADMGQDRISHWVDQANRQGLTFQLPITPDNINNFSENLIIASHLITLEMMRDYHEWLTEQLKKKSLRLL